MLEQIDQLESTEPLDIVAGRESMKRPCRLSIAEFMAIECVYCEFRFIFRGGPRECPHCANRDASQLIPVYQKNSSEIEEMYTKIDLHGG